MEFDAQPATITPYTLIELNARMYSSPALMSASTTSGAKGITAQAASAGVSIRDRKSTRLNSSHLVISYAVFCLKKKKPENRAIRRHKPACRERYDTGRNSPAQR